MFKKTNIKLGNDEPVYGNDLELYFMSICTIMTE